MMHKIRMKSGVITLLCLPLCVHAGDQSTTVLENMIVSASHVTLPVEQVGSSYTIITRQQILDRNVVFISDLLRDVPGIAVSNTGVRGSRVQIRVRGAEANQLLVLIDGIEANDPGGNDEFDFANLLAADIERVEILRGPQSSLYGSDALAGVINIITRKGGGPLQVTSFIEGGSFTTMHSGVGLAFGGERYDFSINASHLDTQGSNVSRLGNEKDGYENETFSFAGSVRPFKQLALDFSGRHISAASQVDDGSNGLPVDADQDNNIEQNYGRAQAKLSLFDGHWDNILGAAITSTENDDILDQVERSSTQGKRYNFRYQSSFFLDTPRFLDTNHVAVFAIERERQEFTQRGQVFFGFDPNQEQEINITSYIGEYRLGLFNQLYLSGSVRHDVNDSFPDTTTHRATLAYLLPRFDTRLHASYGTGVKNPTFVERFGFFSATGFGLPFIGNPDLQPEKSKGWDAGIEQVFFNRRLRLDITYFNEKLTDEINGFAPHPTLMANTALNINGTSNREGYEVTIDATLMDNLELTGQYTYLDATQPDSNGVQEREVRRAEHIASAGLTSRFLEDRASLNLVVQYNGRQVDEFFPPPTFDPVTVELGSYTLVNLAGHYQLNKYAALYGRIDNLLDQDYEEVVGFQTPGVGAFIGIRLNFYPALD